MLGGGCFVQYFTKFLKVKRFPIFYKGFYSQRKIFYKFDHILDANKCLKMRKYFISEQTKCKRMHTYSDLDIQSNQNTHKSIRISMSTIFYLFLRKNLFVSILHEHFAKILTLDHLLYTLFSLNNLFFFTYPY